jgi:hypothetical protein
MIIKHHLEYKKKSQTAHICNDALLQHDQANSGILKPSRNYFTDSFPSYYQLHKNSIPSCSHWKLHNLKT